MTHKIITGSYERDIVLKILLTCNNVDKCRGQKGEICKFACNMADGTIKSLCWSAGCFLEAESLTPPE